MVARLETLNEAHSMDDPHEGATISEREQVAALVATLRRLRLQLAEARTLNRPTERLAAAVADLEMAVVERLRKVANP
jgi:hypothetical protein